MNASPFKSPFVWTLQQIKIAVSALWMLAALLLVVTFQFSAPMNVALALLGALPPLALLLLWNEPTPTLSESIREAQE